MATRDFRHCPRTAWKTITIITTLRLPWMVFRAKLISTVLAERSTTLIPEHFSLRRNAYKFLLVFILNASIHSYIHKFKKERDHAMTITVYRIFIIQKSQKECF